MNKPKALMASIAKQINEQNGDDPFAKIPHDFEKQFTGDDLALAHEQEKLKHYQNVQLTVSTVLNQLKVNGQNWKSAGHNIRHTYNAATRKTALASVGPDDVVLLDRVISTKGLSEHDAKLAKKYGAKDVAIMAKIAETKKKISAIQKAVKNAAIAAAAAVVNATPSASPTGKNIPTKISTNPTSKRGDVDNPYFLGNGYAGAPSGYPFSTPMKRVYSFLVLMFARHGIKLDTLYVGRYGGPSGPINFICQSSQLGNKFVWRKYDTGGGSGQNWIYANGYKINTSTLTQMNLVDQDQFLKLHKII